MSSRQSARAIVRSGYPSAHRRRRWSLMKGRLPTTPKRHGPTYFTPYLHQRVINSHTANLHATKIDVSCVEDGRHP